MAKLISRLSAVILLMFIVWAGCSNPTPNPVIPPPPTRDGVDLDRTATTIAPDPSGLPYIIRNEDWIIPEGMTVTIMPGTEIMIAGRYWIDIQGKLIANGTPGQPIHFTTAFTEPDLGQWRGLKLHGQTENSELRYCIFTWGAFFDTDTLTDRGIDAQHYRGMLAVRNSSPIIEHCIAMFNQNNGLFITNDNPNSSNISAPRVRYNIFTENDASGVRADTTVDLNAIDVSYNCVAENSAPPFIMGYDSTLFGYYSRVNENVDSCDNFYNIDLPPLLTDPLNGDFSLQSCSPCVDAGPSGVDPDLDGTRADMGTIPYIQAAAELRGRVNGTLNAATYRVTCDLVVAPGEELIIPAGARLEATGLYSIEVHGTLRVQGTAGNRCVFCACQTPVSGDIWGGIEFINREFAPSVLEYVDIAGYEQINVFKAGVTFRNVRFDDGYMHGINVNTNSLNLADSVSFMQCEFVNSGEAGILADSSAVFVRQSIVRTSSGRGISLSRVYDAGAITNTIVSACSTTGIMLEDFTSISLINNVVASNGYHGIHLDNNSEPTIWNNIVTSNGRYGILAENSSTPTVDFNDVWNNGLRLPGEPSPNYHGAAASTLEPGPGSIEADPQFVFSTEGDYFLAPGSPGVNAGHPDAAYNDADGSRNDMGAYGGPGGTNVGPVRRALWAQR